MTITACLYKNRTKEDIPFWQIVANRIKRRIGKVAKHHKYHLYQERIFLGKFEKMYKNETREAMTPGIRKTAGFFKKIRLSILQDYNLILLLMLDGKEIFTHLLKKKIMK